MQRPLRTAHAWIWTVLAVGLPACLAVIFASGSPLSPDAPALRLAPPPSLQATP